MGSEELECTQSIWMLFMQMFMSPAKQLRELNHLQIQRALTAQATTTHTPAQWVLAKQAPSVEAPAQWVLAKQAPSAEAPAALALAEQASTSMAEWSPGQVQGDSWIAAELELNTLQDNVTENRELGTENDREDVTFSSLIATPTR